MWEEGASKGQWGEHKTLVAAQFGWVGNDRFVPGI